uniref:HOOK N-terminal domain-containing protein n=1 Tax=Rhizochromulina marina TaxID=1034831 RepID=A0A7S2SUT2_9STRA|mmetsp:Transcript_8731/g.24843  ORF Transcript_8731/g.24843 Transcript_8731/m.24843 type:complete len:672 (+) Transcript_8731:167-2182(+)
MAGIPEGFEEDIPQWINTFDGVSCENVLQLCSGVELTRVMQQIDDSFFAFELVHGDNWKGHKSNVTSLLSALERYYAEVLGRPLNLDHVETTDLCRDRSIEELAKVVGAVVGAALLCEDKDQYIGAIMALPEDAQQTLFLFAQDVMAQTEDEDQAGNAGDEPSGLPEDFSEQVSDLKGQVSALQAENEALREKTERLEAENGRLQVASDEAGARSGLEEDFQQMRQDLTRQNEKLREELERAEEQLRDRETGLTKDWEARLQAASVEFENQLQKLRDEKDILAGKVEDYNKLKSREERMRQKLDEYDSVSQTLRRRVQELDDSNAKHLDRILHLESVENEVDFVKGKMEEYKNQTMDLETKCLELTSQVEVKDQDLAALQEELKDAHGQCQYFENELEEAKQELEAKAEADVDGSGFGGEGLGSFDDIPVAVKERLVRLEKENELLKQATEAGSGSAATDARLEMLQSQADERQEKVLELEKENHQLKHQLKNQSAAASAGAGGQERDERSQQRIEELEKQLTEAQAKGSSTQALTLTVRKLKEQLKEKESENNKLTSDKEKLEAYTKKALHNVQEKYMLAIKTCKEQIKEKEERIQKLTEQYKQGRHQSTREAQLLSSAIYELGMNITEARLARTLDRSGGGKASPMSTTFLQGRRDQVRRGSLQGAQHS